MLVIRLRQTFSIIHTHILKEVLQEVSLEHEAEGFIEEHRDFSEHPIKVVSTNSKAAAIVITQIQTISHGDRLEVIEVEVEEIIEIYFPIRKIKMVGVNLGIFTLPCWKIRGVV
jgi:hypothetical protein